MSEQNWDDEEYETSEVSSKKPEDDRWDGEDEERVKDNWDDEEEETKAQQPQVSAPKKKSKAQNIMEKQAAKEAALAAKRAEIQRMNSEMSPEEKLAEKLRLQKIQEDSDLQFAVDMMGMKEDPPTTEVNSLSEVDISTQSGLEALGEAFIKKIRGTEKLEKRNFYYQFLETFCKDLCVNLEVDELKKINSSLNTLYNEKVKANKPIKGKRKGAGKAKIQLEKENHIPDDDRYINDFDDFI